MPDMDLTDDEVRGVIAFLKWMSAVDITGFRAASSRCR